MRAIALALLVPAFIAVQSPQATACKLETYTKPTVGSADSEPNMLCDELAAAGLVTGYDAESFFINEVGLLEGPYVDFVVDFFNQTAGLAPSEPVLAGVSLREARRRLLTGFIYYLDITQLQAAEPYGGTSTAGPFDLLVLDHKLGGSMTLATALDISANHPVGRPGSAGFNSYSTVATDDPAYSIAQRLCGTPLLPNHPEWLFSGEEARTRYEFGQVIAALLGFFDTTEGPRDNYLLEAGVTAQEFVELYLGFQDQLATMGGCGSSSWMAWS